MSRPDSPALRVTSDLVLEVDGLHASMIADGQHLTVVTNDAGRLMAQARTAALPGAAPSIRLVARQVGRLLDEAGLFVQVVGERGVLVEAGRGCESRLSRIVLGSSHVRLGQPVAAISALTGYLHDRSGPGIRYAPAGLAVALLVISTGLGRRRTRQAPVIEERARTT